MQGANGVKANLCFLPAVQRMKVRWVVFIVVHSDNDSIESAHFWHTALYRT